MATMIRTQTANTPCDAATRTGGSLERTRFYPRQLVTPDDLTQDQVYFREKAKRHNRMLHGWGIVCGACVRRGGGECDVIVEPGYLLGPYGDEIVIDREVIVDVCKLGTGEQDGCCESTTDPWCSDVRANCPTGRLYLAVRYDECVTKPVRHPGGGCGCGCDDDACEYSRVRDGFSIAVLRELPSSYSTPLKQPTIAAIYPCTQRTARGCPPCPPEPWVVLADIVMGDNCRVVSVDCFAHRRHVVTFADFYWACQPRPGATTGIGAAAPPNMVSIARAMSAVSGSATLVDVGEAMSMEVPRATVTMRRSDGSAVAVPAYFNVVADETLGDLLNREGDRELYDPVRGEAVTLRSLYVDAGVPESQPLANAAAALALLEGKTLRDATSEPAKPGRASGGMIGVLRSIVDPSVHEALDADAGRGAATLDASALRSLAGKPTLAKRVEGMTIAAAAAMTEDEFVTTVTKGSRGAAKTEATAAAQEAWANARTVVELVESGGGGDG